MKIYLFTSALLFVWPSFAAERFRCMPSLRQTNIYVEQSADQLVMLISNPMGYEYMPQFDGPTSASTIPFQKMQFEDLKDLANGFVVKWPAKSCTFNSAEKNVQCNGEADTGVAKIKAYTLTTSEITENTRGETYKKLRYRLALEKEGNVYFVSFEFMNSSCETLSKVSAPKQ